MATPMMDIKLDTLNDSTQDLNITSGDFVISESTEEHQRQLLLNGKGSFKENPTICVGIFSYLDDEGLQNLARDTNIELARDGMQVNRIQFTQDGKMNINAYYS